MRCGSSAQRRNSGKTRSSSAAIARLMASLTATLTVGGLLSGGALGALPRPDRSFFHERAEQRAARFVVVDHAFRVPLHADVERMAVARLDGLDDPVTGTRHRGQIVR